MQPVQSHSPEPHTVTRCHSEPSRASQSDGSSGHDNADVVFLQQWLGGPLGTALSVCEATVPCHKQIVERTYNCCWSTIRLFLQCSSRAGGGGVVLDWIC